MIICDDCHSSSSFVKIISFQTIAFWLCGPMWYYVSKQSHPSGYQLIAKNIFINNKIWAIPSFQHNCIRFINDINISVVGSHCRIQYFLVQVIIPVFFSWNTNLKPHIETTSWFSEWKLMIDRRQVGRSCAKARWALPETFGLGRKC